jgi:uncharacterized protein YyaL (SSP411 family)
MEHQDRPMARNRLADETSPYLRQHADNPVAWWAWGTPAFDEARRSDRPVLLSIGYAACHWCHVMAHESFEDPATAEVMNELFVNIKVDREERPDVDQVNMAALQAFGEQGGWPLTMFLTPEGEPFWGGTYFPSESRWGRPAFVDVLRAVADTYRNRRADVRTNADAVRNRLQRQPAAGAPQPLDRAALDGLATRLLRALDPVNGGTAGAPKFPNASLLEFVWRAGDRMGDARLTDAFLLALDRICQGGIYDHVGGGFARYSVDEQWLVPHFEKMLYDNAQLIELLCIAWRITGRELFRRRVAETIDWLLRDMRLPGGAFAASLDADSPGGEGAFYVWRPEELIAVLGPADAIQFGSWYDITAEGNFEGASIPNRLRSGEAEPAVEAALDTARAALLAARAHRAPPGLDDKILADWNGLAIAAIARAATAFERPEWQDAAIQAFDFVVGAMQREGRLGHAWKDDRLVFPGFASDHAAMARAALALHESTGDPAYLDHAGRWLGTLERHYRDGDRLHMSADDGEPLLVRPSGEEDEAVPSAAGLAAEAYLRLAAATGDDTRRAAADRLIAAGADIERAFTRFSLLNALDLRLTGIEVRIAGPSAEDLYRAAAMLPHPIRTIRRASDPAVFGLPDGADAALVCAGERCGLPQHDPDALLTEAARMRADPMRFT